MPTGEMVTAGHLGGYVAGGDPATYYPALWDWLVQEHGIRSVLDVGCGDGVALRHFRGLGCTVRGLDGVRQDDLSIRQHDFETGPPLEAAAYDLCWSCEFVEHVEARFLPNVLAAFGQAPLVLMTHASPGQAGWHHVNCQPHEYWIRAMDGAGYELDAGLTMKTRELAAQNTSPWNHYVRSGLAFRRRTVGRVSRPSDERRTLHVIGLPHTETTSTYSTCAYTQKTSKLGKMLTGRARRVVLYGGHLNEAPCDEHVELVSTEERERWFGKWDPNDAFSKITWNPADEPWAVMNTRAITEIRKRAHPKDLILITAGLAQKPIADAFPTMIACEWAVGYEGIFAKYRAFESYAWMHYLYGKYGTADGRYYDRVIPNFFDPDDFHLEPKEDYLLFIGRLIARKGPHVAAQIAEACGRRLLVAGPGASSVTPLPGGGCRIVGNGVTLEGPHIEYIGSVDPVRRASLMAKAAAVLVPTQYIGPFEGVAVEAMLSGTPAVTSDWGAFGETVDEGVTGYRFRTLAQGVEAVARCQGLDPRKIRARAVSRYSLEAVAPQFEAWFDQLDGLWGEGWNALPAKALPLVYEGA